MKIRRETPDLKKKFRQKYGKFFIKAYIALIVAGNLKSPYKCPLQVI